MAVHDTEMADFLVAVSDFLRDERSHLSGKCQHVQTAVEHTGSRHPLTHDKIRLHIREYADVPGDGLKGALHAFRCQNALIGRYARHADISRHMSKFDTHFHCVAEREFDGNITVTTDRYFKSRDLIIGLADLPVDLHRSAACVFRSKFIILFF